ncbi:MAG: DUF11 domain-containing protein [Opitutaceae bacterium]|nr:DUF11 domain-containing protein [Opitutaceae bacterium]
MNKPTRVTLGQRFGALPLFTKVIALAGLLFSAGVVLQAAAPLAGTIIGNAASATYKDNANQERQVTSNIVTTEVQQVYSFTLESNRSVTVSPGGQVTFPHVLTNTGNGADSYTLTTGNPTGFGLTNIKIYADANRDGQPDNTTNLNGTALPVGPGAEYHFVVVGSAPSTATGSATIDVVATASAAQAPQTHTNTDTATVTQNAVIAVAKSISRSSGASPATQAAADADPLTYTLTYTNTGNTAATAVTITDTIPTNMTYVASSGTWSGSATALTDAAGETATGITYDYNITTLGKVTAVISAVNPGASGTITFKVTVTPNTAPSTINNTAQYSYDPDGAGGNPATTPVPTNTVPYVVNQAGGVAIGDNNSATNGETPSNSSPQIYTVAAANPGSTVTFVNRVYNTGNGTDSFDITFPSNDFPAGTTFVVYKADGNTPLVDTDGNGVPDTGPVAPGGSYDVVIKAILPTDAATGGPKSVTVQAQSHVSGGTNTVVNQLTNIVSLSVDLTNNASAGDAGTQLGENPTPASTAAEASAVVTNTTDPGTTTRFTLHAYNPNGVPDAYDIGSNVAALFNGNPVPTGWTIVFRDENGSIITNTGIVAALGNKKFYADVTVPADAAPATTSVYFRVQSPTTGVFDILHDAVTVNAVRKLSLQPNHSGQTYPGGVVFYDHILTNEGNVTEGIGTNAGSTIELGLSDTLSANGWTSVIYYDANNNGVVDSSESIVNTGQFGSVVGSLAPGAKVGLIVKVFAPAGAPNLASNVTTLTATTTDNNAAHPYDGAEPAVVSVKDTTTVVLGDLSIKKEQATSSGGTYGTAQIQREPGEVIYYKLTVTNTGSANSTEVVVYDTTPAYTTYDSGSGAATVNVTNGSLAAPATITAPANGATGDFKFELGSLAPNTVVVITFAVMVNS